MDRQSIVDAVVDEIALEGLDGITLNFLWIRLASRKGFPVALEHESKTHIWELLCKNDDITMYVSQEPKPPLYLYNRFELLDLTQPELELVCEPEILPDIYPVTVDRTIDDQINGVRGFCSNYQDRKNCSTRVKQLPLAEVVVSNIALAGVNSSTSLESLSTESYIMLERIGRSREHGEVTIGKHALNYQLGLTPQSALSFCLDLLNSGLITQQAMLMKVNTRTLIGELLHLPRFFFCKEQNLFQLMRQLIQVLKEAPPPHMLDYPSISSRLNTSVKLNTILATKEIKQYIKTESVPYRTLHPEASESHWKTRKGTEKSVLVVRLLRADVDPVAGLFKESDSLKERKIKLALTRGDVAIARKYGYETDCVRTKELHNVLFYLVYGYTGEELDQSEVKQLLKGNHSFLDDEMLKDIPLIYNGEMSWKMFMDMLPEHGVDWTDGWCLYADVLERLPLSIFVKIVSVNHKIEGLEHYLEHPIKKHLLLKHLPTDLQQGLLENRKYVFSVFDCVANLAFMGLAQLGPRIGKEKEKVMIYLNKKTSLLDTTTSSPAYHKIPDKGNYEKKDYRFQSVEDIKVYWLEAARICTHTLLGHSDNVADRNQEHVMPKRKHAMVEAMRMRRTSQEAHDLDQGEIPGDHLGAGGFDSSLCTYKHTHWDRNRMRTVGKDRPALLEKPRLNQSRVTWSKNENQFLFMFKVACVYLYDGDMEKSVLIDEVRDFLHRNLEESRNKTSSACSRRITSMMKNQNFCYKVVIAYEELKRNPEIVKISGGGFRQLLEYLKQRYADVSEKVIDYNDSVPDASLLPQTLAEFHSKCNLNVVRMGPRPFSTNLINENRSIYSSACRLNNRLPRPNPIFIETQKYVKSLMEQKVDSTVDSNSMEVGRINEGGCAAMVTSLFSLGRINIEHTIPEDILTIDPVYVEDHEDTFDEQVAVGSTFRNPNSISRLSHHLLRQNPQGKLLSELNKNPKIQKNLEEKLIINSANVFVSAKSADGKDLHLLSAQLIKEVIESIPIVIPSEEPPSETKCWKLYDQNDLNKEVIKEAALILQLVRSTKEDGILISDLPIQVVQLKSSCTLQRHLELLTKSKLILRVGVMDARFVSFDYMHPWRTKPWISIVGKFDRKMLNRLLEAVLSHALTKPGCTILRLVQRFYPAIQPFHTRELVEILAKIGCLFLFCLEKSGKPGLFAPRVTIEKVSFNLFAPDKDVYCDPTVDAILRFGEFITGTI